ncbi:MAG: hypothetical protein SGPRY_003386, partial [Prymnesium sp.]
MPTHTLLLVSACHFRQRVPRDEMESAVFKAALRGDVELLRSLLAQSDRSTAEGYTPLALAVSAGRIEASRMLLAHGVRVDAADLEGVTALMHAAMHGYTELINLLLLHGANPLRCRLDGKSAISLAAEYGRTSSLGAFWRHDAGLVESRDGLGRTPLLCAVTSRHTPTVKYALGRWAADPQAVDDDGNGALHCCRGGLEILLLLMHGSRAGGGEESCAGHKHMLLDACRIDKRLFSFMLESPLRVKPTTQPPL